MRAVFLGAGAITQATARMLLDRGHEVVIVERDKQRIDTLAEDLDCGLLHGDGTRPALLREADPKATDFLFCLTGDDQTNILASLVGRSLGFARIVTKLEDPAFEHICIELGLEDTIVPSGTIGGFLADMLEGRSHLELAALIKDDVRVFSFVAREADEVAVGELRLPADCRVMFLYRDGRFMLADDETRLEADDEVVVVTHVKNIPALHDRWR